jgi:hypothetical protein
MTNLRIGSKKLHPNEQPDKNVLGTVYPTSSKVIYFTYIMNCLTA